MRSLPHALAPLALLLAPVLLGGCGPGEDADAAASPQPRAPRALAPDLFDGGGTPAEKDARPADPTAPVVRFDALERDFGRVPDTGDLRHSFGFENTGGGVLEIFETTASCGCTTPTLTKQRYGPGERGAIDVVWEPKGHGNQSKTITVRSNSKTTPILQLRVTAEIEPFLTAEPVRADFGLVQREETPTLELELSSRDPEFEILDLKSTTPDVQVELVDSAANGRARIRVTLDERQPTRGVRRLFPKLLVTASGRTVGADVPVRHTSEIPVMATLYDQLAPDPAFFPIGRVLPGRTASKEILVRRPGGGDFAITGWRFERVDEAAGMSLTAEPAGGDPEPAWRLTLSCSPGSYVGPVSGAVVLETDIPDEPELRLECYGVAGAAPPK